MKLFLGLFFLFHQALAFPLGNDASTTPLPPSMDPFYKQPASAQLAHLAPGAIIRSRKPPGALSGIAQYTSESIKAAYQLMYRTTNTVGLPAAAVATVIIPYSPNYNEVLFYQSPYDSADINCSPSYTLQQKSNGSSESDVLFMASALNNGWVVVNPDYEGLTAAFVAGVGSGQAVLDAVRATLASHSITGVSNQAKYALWGYSGGALGSEWGLEIQPQYAPELDFIGAALGGLTPNATNVLNDVNGGAAAGLVFNGINGLMAGYPNMSSFLTSSLIPSTAAEFESVRTSCGNSSAPSVAGKNVFDYFKQGEAILYDKIPKTVLHWGTNMGLRAPPRPPLYAYKAIADEVSPVADTDALVKKYCSRGVRIEYLRNTVGEHLSEAVTGAGGALAWLKDRFAGVKVAKGCSTKTVTVSQLSPEDIEEFGTVISSALDLLLSQDLNGGGQED